MPNLPNVYKTYQDVKNNITYWTIVLLVAIVLPIYPFFLGPVERKTVSDLAATVGGNALFATLAAALIVALFSAIAYVLIWLFQIHDAFYDGVIIKWRERYDTEFVLPLLTNPFRDALPDCFGSVAKRNRYQFMKPYYEFVGDGKPGIRENTRIRFYERVTAYWNTQVTEVFIVFALIGSCLTVIFYSGIAFTVQGFALFEMILIALGILNRWFKRCTLADVEQATKDEIEEILAKPDNVSLLKARYTQLMTQYK